MSVARTIAHNTAIQMVGKIVGTLLSLTAAALVLRHLGAEGMGRYTTIIAFLQIFGILMDAGLYIVLIKQLASVNAQPNERVDDPAVHTIVTLRIISGVVFLGCAPLVAWVLSWYNPAYGGEVLAGIALTTLFYFFISMNQLLSAVFQKALHSEWIAVGEFVGKVVLLVATVVAIWLDAGLLPIMVTLVLSSGANFLVNLVAANRYVRIRLMVDWPRIRRVLRDAWPIALSIAFGLMYFKGDTIILTFYAPEEVVGWYGAPYKILEVLVTLPAMFTGLVLPIITGAWQRNDREMFGRVLQRSFDALVFIAVPMILGTWLLSPAIIDVLAGSEFAPSIPVLNILIIATAAIFLGTLFGYVVVSLDKQRTMLWGYAFIAGTALAGYAVVIPRYSIIGAAWVTVYSEVTVMLIALVIVLRTAHVRLSVIRLFKSITASAAMVVGILLSFTGLGALSFLLTGDEWFGIAVSSPSLLAAMQLVIALVIGAVVYGGMLLLLRAVTRDELREFISLRRPSYAHRR